MKQLCAQLCVSLAVAVQCIYVSIYIHRSTVCCHNVHVSLQFRAIPLGIVADCVHAASKCLSLLSDAVTPHQLERIHAHQLRCWCG